MFFNILQCHYLSLNSRDEADKEFQECSELAQSEIKAFHQKRITEFRLALLYHTEVGQS